MAKFGPLLKPPEWTEELKQIDTIDYLIDLNNLAKFGFGKLFTDGGTHTQHNYKGSGEHLVAKRLYAILKYN